jgi:ribosomal protein S18 acetylase RimI-like enzyme
MTEGTGEAGAPGPALRHPTEDDQPRIVALVDEWFSGRRVRHLVGRSWFRHFGSTSWLAVDDTGQPLGFLLGYRSPDRPDEAVVHLIGVHPNQRRRGIGRYLVATFIADMQTAGARTVNALAWPGEPPSTAFFRAVGFQPDEGPGSQNLFGTTAFADYDGAGEDRIVFVLQLPTEPTTNGVAAPDA